MPIEIQYGPTIRPAGQPAPAQPPAPLPLTQPSLAPAPAFQAPTADPVEAQIRSAAEQALGANQQQRVQFSEAFETPVQYRYSRQQRMKFAQYENSDQLIRNSSELTETQKQWALRQNALRKAGILVSPTAMPRDPDEFSWPEGKGPGALWRDKSGALVTGEYDSDGNPSIKLIQRYDQSPARHRRELMAELLTKTIEESDGIRTIKRLLRPDEVSAMMETLFPPDEDVSQGEAPAAEQQQPQPSAVSDPRTGMLINPFVDQQGLPGSTLINPFAKQPGGQLDPSAVPAPDLPEDVAAAQDVVGRVMGKYKNYDAIPDNLRPMVHEAAATVDRYRRNVLEAAQQGIQNVAQGVGAPQAVRDVAQQVQDQTGAGAQPPARELSEIGVVPPSDPYMADVLSKGGTTLASEADKKAMQAYEKERAGDREDAARKLVSLEPSSRNERVAVASETVRKIEWNRSQRPSGEFASKSERKQYLEALAILEVAGERPIPGAAR